VEEPGASAVLEPGIVRAEESVARAPDGSATGRSLAWIEVVGFRADEAGELNAGAAAVRGETESIEAAGISLWIGPGGFPAEIDAEELPSLPALMLLQSEPPDPPPVRGLNGPMNG
jgi:hypothetical protein